ncbi:hypothetical protein E2C01_042067 [Portunus trituberculatus]|uniref:Uncharacterized protein n=1 Tax=Portunus trituberculatus TaxID=210409 RepID=A0A5B7FSP5_PORTR|nr:hypothetical protein [Portunus trituberculatus]
MWFPDVNDSGRDATLSPSSACWRPASPTSVQFPLGDEFMSEFALCHVTGSPPTQGAEWRERSSPALSVCNCNRFGTSPQHFCLDFVSGARIGPCSSLDREEIEGYLSACDRPAPAFLRSCFGQHTSIHWGSPMFL